MKKIISLLISISMLLSMCVVANAATTITVDNTAFDNVVENYRKTFFNPSGASAFTINNNGIHMHAGAWVTLNGTAAEAGMYDMSVNLGYHEGGEGDVIEVSITGGGYALTSFTNATNAGTVYLPAGDFEVRVKNLGTTSYHQMWLKNITFTPSTVEPSADTTYLVDGRKNNEGASVEGWSNYLPVELLSGTTTTVSFDFYVVADGNYVVMPYTASKASQILNVSVDEAEGNNYTVAATGDYYTYAYTNTAVAALDAGNHTVTITATSPTEEFYLENVMLAPTEETESDSSGVIVVDNTAFDNVVENYRKTFFNPSGKTAFTINHHGIHMLKGAWVTLKGTAEEAGMYDMSVNLGYHEGGEGDVIEVSITGGSYALTSFTNAANAGTVYLPAGDFEVRVKDLGTTSYHQMWLKNITFTPSEAEATADMTYMVDGRKNNEGNYIEGWSHYLPTRLDENTVESVSYDFHVAADGYYTVELFYASQPGTVGTRQVKVALDDGEAKEFTVRQTADNYTYVYADTASYAIPAGDHTITVTGVNPVTHFWLEAVKLTPCDASEIDTEYASEITKLEGTGSEANDVAYYGKVNLQYADETFGFTISMPNVEDTDYIYDGGTVITGEVMFGIILRGLDAEQLAGVSAEYIK